MAETPTSAPDRALPGEAIVWLVVLLGVPVVGLLLFLFGPTFFDSRLRECEDALKAQLKAPSTYERISYRRADGEIRIAYDAANSFGVPLRGSGVCFDHNGVTRWLDDDGGAGLR